MGNNDKEINLFEYDKYTYFKIPYKEDKSITFVDSSDELERKTHFPEMNN